MNREISARRRRDIGENAHRRVWVDRVMAQVRKAASRKHGGLLDSVAGTVAVSPGRTLPGFWSPAAARLEQRSEYRLADLLAFSDADFVEQCYRIVLRRGPDPEGFRHHLGRMQSGAATKVEVLGDIRFSSEGRMQGVHVDGLLVPYTLHRWMRKPLIGTPLRWAHGLARVGALAERQGVLDTAQARETHALGHHVNRIAIAVEERFAAIDLESASKADIDTVRALGDRCDEAESSLDALARHLRSLSERCGGIESSLGALDESFRSHRASLEGHLADKVDREPFRVGIAALTERMSSIETHSATLVDGGALQRELSGLIERLQAFENSLREQADANEEVERRVDRASGELRQKLEGLERKAASGEDLAALAGDLAATGGRLEGLDARLSGVVQDMQTKAAKQVQTREDLDGFYSAFEDNFRGSRDLIHERLQPYVQWIRDAQAGSREFPVLDIGCGRGEWLQLLRDHDMIASGVDTNRLFVGLCEGRGLDVAFGDGIAHLDAKAEGSVGAITAIHVVEHLEFETMIALIDSAKRALRPGGLLVLETPNPENVMVGACNFYLDPTHRNPIPPIALRWMVEARGFHSVRIERLTHARGVPSWEPPAADAPGAEAIVAMSSAFAAAPDYAIVAVRP